MEIKVEQISGIARPLSFRYPTNRAIIIIVALIIVLGTPVKLLLGSSFLSSIVWAFGTGGALFFSWALTRELDPDHNASAFIAVTVTLAVFFITDLPNLLALLWLLIVIRILNRITGIAPTIFDLIGTSIVAIVLNWQATWLYGLITALVLYIHLSIDSKKSRRLLLVALLILLVVVSAILGITSLITISASLTVMAMVLSILFIPPILFTNRLQSLTDITEEPVSVSRLRITRVVAIVTGFLVVLTLGNDGFYDLLPLWSAVVGILLYYLYLKVVRLRYR